MQPNHTTQRRSIHRASARPSGARRFTIGGPAAHRAPRGPLRFVWLWLVFHTAIAACAAEPAGQAEIPGASAPSHATPQWTLPDARDVELGGSLGDAFRQGVRRLGEDPYRSVVFLRSDLTFEMPRWFTNFSGDVSGRFLEIASLTSPAGKPQPAALGELLKTVADYQKADGHFGRDIDWSKPIDDPPDNTDAGKAIRTPVFWGNSRLLMGLLEAHAAFADPKLLSAAKGIGDFYVNGADVYLDPNREALFKSTGSYSSAYVTDYFPAIEGLTRLYQVTRDERYLRQAERMAEFFKRFDRLPIDHSHGNLIAYHGLMLLYETTLKRECLARSVDRWKEATEGGYVWSTGGVGERFHVRCETDEGCSEADWLRLNLDLWRATGETRFLDAAERLVCNHYEMNRTANGGYGHHNFVCDAEGPLLMQPHFVEAVWCCTFHGLLGMRTLASHVLAGSDRGVFVNFPFDASAPVRCRDGVRNVTVRRQPDSDGAVACRIRVDGPRDDAVAPSKLFVRRPSWAEDVQVTDANGRAVEAPCEAGYLCLPTKPGPEGELTVSFLFAPRVEDRRMRRLAIDPSRATRHRGVVLGNGPCVLLANSDQPRPTIVLSVDKTGRLRLPKADDGTWRVAAVAGVDATEQQAREAAGKAGTVVLGPWRKMDPSRAVALVFDLIVLPD